MIKASLTALAATLSLGVPFAQPALAQEDVDQRFGTVHFPTSCNEVAQRRFDRGMRYQHSFWYTQAKEVFEEVAKADPTCGMAYWGIALTYLNNPHSAIPAPDLQPGLAAIQKAKEIGAKTQRERDYMDALALMYVDYDKIPQPARIQTYLKAQEAVATRYPDDDEAQIAYAITLNVAASPADKTYANQLKGIAILEPIFKRQPRHPGVAHYLIHLYDYPALADKGLNAAKLYSQIAPAAPHAQHMPSHIFSRVGYWMESVASNMASVKAAMAGKEAPQALHAWDYMVYAYLQLAQDRNAHTVLGEMTAATEIGPDDFGAQFALAASPARYAMERGDWAGAAALDVRQSKFAQVMAITHFARSLGAARTGKPDAARTEVAKLAELRDKLREAKTGYWAQQVDIQWQLASAWLLYAEGKQDDALKAMAVAADAEDKTEKAPVTPGPIMPARELYGEMLLDRGMAKEALAAFDASKAKEPNRFHGLLGAAKAAEKLGDKAVAKANYEKLVDMVGGGQSDRAEVVAARQYLSSN